MMLSQVEVDSGVRKEFEIRAERREEINNHRVEGLEQGTEEKVSKNQTQKQTPGKAGRPGQGQDKGLSAFGCSPEVSGPQEVFGRAWSGEQDLAFHDYEDSFRMYMKEIDQFPLLKAEEERELARRMKEGDEQAKKRMVESNLRLVVSIARKYERSGVPLMDLIQEGNLGLIRAAEKFDYTLGNRFSTYATWWIRKKIGKAYASECQPVHVPANVLESASKVQLCAMKLESQLGRLPTEKEIAQKLHMTENSVKSAQMVSRKAVSLDAPLGEKSDSCLQELVKDELAPSPEQKIVHSTLREELLSMLNILKPQEKNILILRYGLLDGKSLSLEEISQKMSLSKERIRQIEQGALARLRVPMERKGMGEFLTA